MTGSDARKRMSKVKPLITPETEEWIPTPEEEAMLEEAIAAADRGDLIEVDIIDGKLVEVPRTR